MADQDELARFEVHTGDAALDATIRTYIAQDQYGPTREELLGLLKQGATGELQARFGSRMAFGTAGLRAAMGVGTSRMNDLTVIQATQGLQMYVQKHRSLKSTVVIGYDARHNSRRFAQRAAAVFLLKGHRVLLFSAIVPTPFVAYAVRKYDCAAGIMVTASHNPKEDNGYKVYWAKGAQIIPPIDSGISREIGQNLAPWLAEVWQDDFASGHPQCSDIYSEVMASYYKDVAVNLRSLAAEGTAQTHPTVTYTAMHGVGHGFIREAFQVFGLNPVVPVVEQVEPDPEFPTVKYPNPEEGKGALELAMKTADAANSTLIFANDPDADRLAVAAKHDGEWRLLTGNETGAVLGWWCWTTAENKGNKENMYMLSSTVSSMILRSMAAAEGFGFEDTLTGFKWMGNRAADLEDQGKSVLFAFEEAIGFCVGTTVLDKDGISAAVAMAKCANHLAEQGKTLVDKLNEIHAQYGYHATDNSYYVCREQATIQAIFDGVRKYLEANKEIGPHKIVRIRDLDTGVDTASPNKKATLPPSKNMITIELDNQVIFTLRPSGTEPKMKYYSEIRDTTASTPEEKRKVAERLHAVVLLLVDTLLQPDKFGLKAKGAA